MSVGPFCPRVVCEEKKMNRKMLYLARAVVYLLAFLVPPVLVSVMGLRAVESFEHDRAPWGAGGAGTKRRPGDPTAAPP
jgi:hypothetical protein